MDLNRQILSDIMIYTKYARYLPTLNRRETWGEIVDRNKEMHLRKFPNLADQIEKNYEYVYRKEVLPSMRSLQFAGKPIEIANNRLFNCAFTHISNYKSFAEVMFLLLGGSGAGFSVQRHHIEKLPPIRKPLKSKRYLVADSIEGWADAVKMLIKAYMIGTALPIFDFSDIRPKGARLITSGGKAPGSEPLKECLFHIQKILDRKNDGEQLTSLECHDVLCHIADSVLAGGIRRSSTISLFDVDDEEMLSCKFGDWQEQNPQRARANNSAVVVRHKVKEKDFWDLWGKVEASRSGEPGLLWTHDKDMGINPSLRKGTKVLTKEGIYPIDELENKEFQVKNLYGNWSPAKCFLSGKDKPLYRVKLRGNKEFYATAEHQWPIWSGNKFTKVATKDLSHRDKLPIITEFSLFEGDKGNYEDGFLIGWLYGDGWHTVRKDNGKHQYGLIVSEKDAESGILDRLTTTIKDRTGSGVIWTKREYKSVTYELNFQRQAAYDYFSSFGVGFKQDGLPTAIWQGGSEEFRKGFIDGLFSSDGCVSDGTVSFNSSREKLANEVAELLGFYGIKVSIFHTVSKGDRTFPNGKTYVGKVYNSWRVRTSDEISTKHFTEIFTLSLAYKQERIAEYVKNVALQPYHRWVSLESVELTDLKEDVWDISVFDTTHCFQLSHCITGNCGEISLRSSQFCNLTTINCTDQFDQQEFENRSRAASFIGTLQASYTNFHYLSEGWKKTTEKESLLGVSLISAASDWFMSLDHQSAALAVADENEIIAKKIGINKGARLTALKPEGSSSLSVGGAAGVHPYWDDYWIRTMRLGKNEDIYNYLSIYLPELLEDEILKPHLQSVLSIPMKAPEGAITRNEGPIALLERVKKLNQGWIRPGHRKGANTNNVSCTVNVKDDEWKEVGEWMWANRDYYNCISVLPFDGGSYKQAPFQACTKEKYEELTKLLTQIDLSRIVEYEDETSLMGEIACGGGSCEIT